MTTIDPGPIGRRRVDAEEAYARLALIGGTARFIFMTVSISTGRVLWTSDPYSEAELREYLRDVGMTDADIEVEILAAREQPV